MKYSALGSIIGALSLIDSVYGIKNAAVYKFNSQSSISKSEDVKLLPQSDATLNLAYGLDIAQYYNVESTNVEDLNNIVYGNHHHSEGSDGKTVIIINGVENPSTLFNSYEAVDPTYNIKLKDDRQASNFKSFVQGIPAKWANLGNNGLNKLSNEISVVSKDSNNKVLKNLQKVWSKKFHDDETNQIETFWNALKSVATSINQETLNINERYLNYVNDESYIKDLTQLDFFLNNAIQESIKNDKTFITIDSLITIFKKTGLTQTYQTCENLISKLLVEKLNELVESNKAMDITIIALPIDQSLTTLKSNESFQKNKFTKRQEEAVNIFKKSSSGATCYANQLECIESTNSCSDHGICSLVGSCYQCVCSSTTDENDRTNFWTGSACEKQDYSSQFNLLFWTSIILTLSIVSGIKLMYQCGSDELPGVLLAATVQTKKST